MSTRAMGPGQGWAWLVRAVNLGRANPKAVIGGIALVTVAVILAQVVVQTVLARVPGPLVTILAMLLLFTVFWLLIAGALRVIDAAERGAPASPNDVFGVFGDGGLVRRTVGFGLLMTLGYVLVFGTIFATFGDGFPQWSEKVLQMAQEVEANGGKVRPEDVPPLPAGSLKALALCLLFGMFLSGTYAIGIAQVSLGGRDVFTALRDGASGVLKNLLPILVLALLSIAGLMALTFVVFIVGAVVAIVGGLVHPSLTALLLLPLSFGVSLVMHVVMFGVMYHMWRDICAEPVAPPPLPDNQVEL